MKQALETKGIDYEVNAGDGAFYGPKIDIKLKDAIGRTWQCATVQCDFALPERFDMHYVGQDGKKHRPVMVHRALLGSLERFLGILIEHYAGKFPFWLSPIQVRIIPITDRQQKATLKLKDQLTAEGYRVDADNTSTTMNHKVREGILEKIPYLAILGDRELEQGNISIRQRNGKNLGAMTLEAFSELLKSKSTPGAVED